MRLLNERDSLVRALKMLPVECVVRNICAGSMAKRLGIPEGTVLPEPIFEFFYKSDPLKDPLVNDEHIRVLGWANATEIAEMKALTLKVNSVLKPLFANAGMDLVDYKLEFGHALDDPTGAVASGRRVHAGWLPAVGPRHPGEARQGPLPPQSRQRHRQVSRGRRADRRAAVACRRRR